MVCAEIHEKLSAYTDEALDKRVVGAVESHLASCADCREELSLLETFVSAARLVEEVEPPAGLRERIREATTGLQDTRPSVGIAEWLRGAMGLRWVGGAAAAAAVAVALVMVTVVPQPPASTERAAVVKTRPVAAARVTMPATQTTPAPRVAAREAANATDAIVAPKPINRQAPKPVRVAIGPKIAKPAPAGPDADDLTEPSVTGNPSHTSADVKPSEPVKSASGSDPAPETKPEEPRVVRLAPIKVASAPAESSDNEESYITQVKTEAAMRSRARSGGLRLFSTKF